MQYTQYPIIRNSVIRNSAQFWGKFKKRALGRSNLRKISKNLRNAQCSDFQLKKYVNLSLVHAVSNYKKWSKRLGVEFWGKFKKRALGRSDLRNA